MIDAATLATIRAQRIRDIDSAAAAIYGRFAPFQLEYELREKQAATWLAGGFASAVPRQVGAFADRANIDPPQACQIILQQAAILRGALDALGDLRMRKFELARAHAADPEGLADSQAQAIFANIMQAIDALGASVE